jgi:hypothetical protein
MISSFVFPLFITILSAIYLGTTKNETDITTGIFVAVMTLVSGVGLMLAYASKLCA